MLVANADMRVSFITHTRAADKVFGSTINEKGYKVIVVYCEMVYLCCAGLSGSLHYTLYAINQTNNSACAHVGAVWLWGYSRRGHDYR